MKENAKLTPDAGYILIVEDDETTGDLMALILESEGFQVKIAHSCDAAMAVVEKEKPAVVLLDYLLKGETCEKMIAGDGRLAGAPVVLVSASNFADDVFKRLRLAAVIHKPFDVESLTELVRLIHT